MSHRCPPGDVACKQDSPANVNEALLLQTPEQHDYTNPAVELNPKRLRSWLKELPLMNLLASLRELIDALEPSNRQQMPIKLRMRLLELYRETVVDIFASTEEEHLRRLPITGAQRKQIKDDTGRLCTMLAAGYKLVIKEGHQQQINPARQPLLLLAIYRAMESGVLVLLHSFRTYQPTQPFSYLDIHQIYSHAERHGVVNTPITYDKKTLAPGGISPLYKRIMLLAATDPYHFGPGTAMRLYDALAPYAALCRIEPGRQPAPEPTSFVIDLDGDSPPLPNAKVPDDMPIEQPRLLDVGPAIDKINKLLAAPDEPDNLARPSPEECKLLDLLLPELSKDRIRRAPRKAVTRETRLALGLDAVHYFLSKGARQLTESYKEDSLGIEVHDVDSESEARHNLEPWTILNESSNGYLLTGQRKGQREVRVGEAVGLVLPTRADSEPTLTLATVRWLRNAKDGRVEIGIEVIPGAALPVACQSADTFSPGYGALACLLLPSVPALGLAATVVAPKRLYSRNMTLDVKTGNESMKIRAGHLVMDTAAYDRFEFETLQD